MAMGPGQYAGFMILALVVLHTCPISGRPVSDFMDDHEVQEGTKKCGHTFSMNVSQGDSASLTLPINTEKQILVSRNDFRKHKKTKLLLRTRNNLNRLENKTEVSLVNQNLTLQRLKKADEGLYQIKEYNSGRCLAQVNVTVIDPPRSPGTTNLPNAQVSVTSTPFPPEKNISPPSTGATNLTNANISVTLTPFPPEENKTVVYALAILILILILAFLIFLILKCNKGLKEIMSKYKCHVSSVTSSSEEV